MNIITTRAVTNYRVAFFDLKNQFLTWRINGLHKWQISAASIIME